MKADQNQLDDSIMSSLALKPRDPSATIATPSSKAAEDSSLMRMVLFMAVIANSADLLATTLGIHHYHNREGNPLLAGLAHDHWLLFTLIKGGLVPLLIYQLYRYRKGSPWLANAGMVLVTIVLTIAVGQWLGWMAGREYVANILGL